MSNDQKISLIPFGVRHGIILGLIAVTFILLIYIISYDIMVNWWFSLLTIVLITSIVVYFGIQFRYSIGGYIGYGTAFRLSLLMLIIYSMIQVAFGLLLYNVIDPELPELLSKASIDNMEAMYRSFGMSQQDIDNQIEILEVEIPKQFQPLNQIKNSWIILISSLIFSAIAALFIRRNKPLIDNVNK